MATNRLPYFKWYPADAETDSNFRAMDDADIGFYIRCLNHAWINGGIPADPAERARVLRTRRDTADKRWLRVGPCFTTCELDSTILVNSRQESERIHAKSKSVKAAESVKHRYERTTNESPRAYESVSDASTDTFLREKKPSTKNEQSPDLFDSWLEPWPRVGKPDDAARAWLSVVTEENVEAAFAARDRYLASAEVERGVVQEPANWLFAQSRGGWAGKWPRGKVASMARPQPKAPTQAEEIDALRWMAANDEDPEARRIANERLKELKRA